MLGCNMSISEKYEVDNNDINSIIELTSLINVEKDPLQAQQEAFTNLPRYEVSVINRKSHKDLGETEYARFTQELVNFSDGAVRLLTRAEPKASYFAKNISPYPISSGDALFTGPDGLNKEYIDEYAKLGFNVIWLHHQGRHTNKPDSIRNIKNLLNFLTTKSVGKSAHHDHALLDDLENRQSVDFDTFVLIRDGFSRSAMSGEAFIAEAPNYKRSVVHSDLSAKCFALNTDINGLFYLAKKQGPDELKGFLKVVKHVISREIHGENGITKNYAGTLDLHPLNLIHEIAWIPTLVNGDNGIYSRAIPLHTSGVRGFLNKDRMSQYKEHEIIHEVNPNLVLIVEDGAHVDGAIVENKIKRFRFVMEYMKNHDMSITGLKPKDYIPEYYLKN